MEKEDGAKGWIHASFGIVVEHTAAERRAYGHLPRYHSIPSSIDLCPKCAAPVIEATGKARAKIKLKNDPIVPIKAAARMGRVQRRKK
jgi:hypothetical protein